MALSVDRLSRIIRNWAEQDAEISKVYIFGSRARGEARDDSDLDVALEFKPEFNDCANWIMRAKELRESLQPALPCQLQLEWYGGPIETEIIHKGLEAGHITVYETAI